ncbi:hypothetical protein EWM64_g2748 [Hericium alpestre]|uniref:Uncharacterized protein n=1 Tax=Hericium alpestre TaxID=135208 RepID=A0A4Z0A4U2_9AGAM|nr:hypothetical protein EWM64_g2748 [Hericium alpestre]
MPLFGSRQGNADEALPEQQRPPTPPHQRGSIFSRRSRSQDHNGDDVARSPTTASQSSSGTHGIGRRGFLFGRRRSSDGDFSATLAEDPSILNAQQKVSDAEAAEREADRALSSARAAGREAKQHVERLEREALEDARRAKAKQEEAKNVRKSASGLGRHG